MPDIYTKLLIHANGDDGSTIFTDYSVAPHTVTAVGNAQVDTAQSKFGGASCLLDGTGDYLSIPDNADWNLGTGDFTIDLWVRFNSLQAGMIWNQGATANTNRYYWYFTGSALAFHVWTSSVNTINISKSWSPSTNTWYHIALVRTGNDFKMFVDGTQIGTTTTDTDSISDYSGIAAIGSETGGATYLDGWIDEFRFSKGIARWTTTFTPPASEYESNASLSLPIFTLSSVSGNGANFTLPIFNVSAQAGAISSSNLPIFSVSAQAGAISSLNLPMLLVASESNHHGLASLTLPQFTITAIPPPSLVTLPVFSVSAFAHSPNDISLSLPSLTVQAARTYHGSASIKLPKLTSNFIALTGAVEGVSISLPRFTFSIRAGLTTSLLLPGLDIAGVGFSGIKGTYKRSLPRMTVNVKATQQSVGSFDVSLPAFTLDGLGLTGEISLSSTRNLPGLQINARGTIGRNSDGAMSLPTLLLTANSFQSLEGTVTISLGIFALDAFVDSHVNRII